VFIGASIDPNYSLNISITQHMMNGTQLLGCCEGDAIPQEVCDPKSVCVVVLEGLINVQFIPKLIKHYRDGQLPINKIIKFYQVCHRCLGSTWYAG
jgi:hypothetical protein